MICFIFADSAPSAKHGLPERIAAPYDGHDIPRWEITFIKSLGNVEVRTNF